VYLNILKNPFLLNSPPGMTVEANFMANVVFRGNGLRMVYSQFLS
jgi:hypothetical protein